jgi:hypothetical protein
LPKEGGFVKRFSGKFPAKFGDFRGDPFGGRVRLDSRGWKGLYRGDARVQLKWNPEIEAI